MGSLAGAARRWLPPSSGSRIICTRLGHPFDSHLGDVKEALPPRRMRKVERAGDGSRGLVSKGRVL
jgi:hypothetical protein